MRTLRDTAIATLTLLALAAPALSSNQPAEPPPEGFGGRQYVDSQGCVFVRVEVDGQVGWAPRLQRDRSPLCGFQPTLAAGLGQTTGSLPDIRPDAPPVILDTASVVETAAPGPDRVVRASAEVPRPGVARRTGAAAAKAPATRASHIPKGYKPVWEDDRLNPHRAKGTPEGEAQMRRLWTDTVPMRLVGD